jgi:hypothetical protein
MLKEKKKEGNAKDPLPVNIHSPFLSQDIFQLIFVFTSDPKD